MRKYLILGILILFLAASFSVWWGFYLPKTFGSEKETIFTIENGQGAKEISLSLEKESLIKRASLFKVYVFFRGISKELQAGIYQLSPSMGIAKIAEKFASGDTAKIEITIPEGFTIDQIEMLLNSKFKAQNSKLQLKTQKLNLYNK